MKSFEKFDKTKLSGKKDFYSLLTNKHISDKHYKQAMKVWNEFGIWNDLYCY